MKILVRGILPLLTLVACSAPQVTAPSRVSREAVSPIARYYPVEPGRQWRYALRQTTNGEPTGKVRTLEISIEDLPDQAGEQNAVLRKHYPQGNTQPRPTLVRRFSDRVELSHYQPLALSQDIKSLTEGYIVAMKTPFQVGQKWEGRSFKGGTETIEIMGFEPVSVPAGEFETLKIHHLIAHDNGNQDHLYYWYAPGVGMVKMHEEATVFFGKWLKLVAIGELEGYQGAGTAQ